MADQWHAMGAVALGAAIGQGEIDPVELAESFLDAAGSHPDTARIYARLTPERARAEALAARDRARSGTRRGPLDGVPLSWKDLYDSAGVATEAGSRLLEGRVPGRDAEVLATATLGGGVCLGKTHMTELAFSGLGLNPMTATPPNVNDPGRVPGGSSSGAAASVAFALAPAAVGSDTGGSVRVPAAWNDLVGLKTTAGRLSLEGVVPLAAGFDTVGPITRNVEDAAALLALLEGSRPARLEGGSLSGMRLAVLDTLALDGLRAAPARGFERALARFAAAGAAIVHIAVPQVAQAFSGAGMLIPAEAYAQWGEAIEAAPERMYPEILTRFRQGAGITAAAYLRGQALLAELRAGYHAAVAGFDAVLLPTSPILPPDRERLLADSEYFAAENLLALRNTRIGNLMGVCALTLPTGEPSCGVTLMGLPGGEERLLRLGLAAERALA